MPRQYLTIDINDKLLFDSEDESLPLIEPDLSPAKNELI